MAHRETRKNRVLVIAAGLFLALGALWLRAGYLQIIKHRVYVERADRNQEQRVLLSPTRGQLLDRYGRPLARDLVTYSISAAPREMREPRATARDLARVLDTDPKKLEREFAARPRFQWVARHVAPDLGQQVDAWGRRGVYVAAETRREYTLGAAAVEVLGRTNLDNSGVEGLELQYDEELRGRAGWETRIRDGRGRVLALERGMRRQPDDGRNVMLTLDADLQSIVEGHLARAVDSLDAVRGFALFMDPRSGEVLACVNVPHLPAGRARNWNFTDAWEPGSTFKVVVTGGVIEEGLVEPDQYFEAAADGKAQVAPGAIFHDVHKQVGFTLREAVRWSSNIVMGKLGVMLGPDRLYRYATELGFGSITGLAFPGEAGGKLRSPAQWSGRSAPTIAIGHELSVTPLQLALAYSAIANGGVLMHPMMVREVREAGGGGVRRFTPHAQRRVFSEATTRTLRELLTAVVDSGTAKAARVPGLAVAGKTGTAQKYDASVGTYGRGMYLSSFVGFAPANDPRLVGVIVIDEPRGRHYYGGEIAAPVFRQVLNDLLRLPRGLLESGGAQLAARPPAPAGVVVPDLRLLQPSAVSARLAEVGLRARLRGHGPRVVTQEPLPGGAIERGASVLVWLEAPTDSARVLPDLVGLSLRAALRRLGTLEVRTRIDGVGLVVRQSPAPGTPLPLSGPCRVWCDAVTPPLAYETTPAVAASAP